MSKKLTRDFYLEDAVLLSQKLIGKKLIHKTPFGTLSGMIVETEAYRGMDDQASHAYPNRNTPRTRIQFGQGGFAYVYKIYGMYDCFNVVTGEKDQPMSSLIRAIMPLEGLKEMYKFRKVKKEYDLGNGPGKLCAALKITKEQYGMDLCGDELYL
ncbi:MAG TPA: DNA-3-methyladenine glycosylase [Candidatus Dorea intestinavium]|nr:DNA-3-methyladenine glycosylase [Candidatus Dorea intestinavium]